jgi:hypothetical protein
MTHQREEPLRCKGSLRRAGRIRTGDLLTPRRTQGVSLTGGNARKHPLTGSYSAQQFSAFRAVSCSLADSPRTLGWSDDPPPGAKCSLIAGAATPASRCRPFRNPRGERRNRVLVSGSGRQLEDDASTRFSVSIARRRSPCESVAETELDHVDEPDPLVAVRERVVLDDARAQHCGFGGQVGIELDTIKRCSSRMQRRFRQLQYGKRGRSPLWRARTATVPLCSGPSMRSGTLSTPNRVSGHPQQLPRPIRSSQPERRRAMRGRWSKQMIRTARYRKPRSRSSIESPQTGAASICGTVSAVGDFDTLASTIILEPRDSPRLPAHGATQND